MTDTFFGISRQNFTDDELKLMATAVADAVAQQVRIDKLEEALKSVADYVSDAADGKLWAYNHGWAMKRVDTEMAAEDQVRIREALKGPE